MKNLLFVMLAATALTAHAAPAGSDTKHQAPAAGGKSAMTIPYQVVQDYFVSNQYAMPANGISCIWLDSQAGFDEVFKFTPPLMERKPAKTVSLDGATALAVIYEGKTVPEIKVSSVEIKDNVLLVSYTKTKSVESTATYRVPLIVVIENAQLTKAGGAKAARFIENGKEIGTAYPPAAKPPTAK